jgi:endonuclease YncB( thermonuclease family)
MFGWRKKNQGFEWHQYVRTTIKHRRDDRRQRVDNAKQKAIDGVKGAGKAGVAASARGAKAAWSGLLAMPGAAVERFTPGLNRAIWATVDVIGGIYDSLPKLMPKFARFWPKRLSTKGWGRGLAGVSAAAALLWVGSLLAGPSGPVALGTSGLGIAKLNPFSSTVVEGNASAVTGDVLRLQGQLIRLAGIEAPDREQRCGNAAPTKGQGKRWACGEAATEMLARTVRGKPVRCSLSGQDDLGRARGTCTVNQNGTAQNVSAELVRVGLAFSDGGLLSGFGSLERDARNQKLGIWRGDADRPSEHRAKVWAEAQKAAPDGCPIKGQMVGDAKRYVMPWQQDYARAKVRTQKGERWFCSEKEAKAAGWKVAERS